jgi:heme A synthase
MPLPIYALVVLGVNLFVILWGAVVRASGSGAGCGEHWPLCNGEILPQSPATATLIEFTHRVSSGIALFLVIGLFWWSRRAFPAGHRARTAALWSLAFICSEALVGAGLVLLHLVGDDASPLRAIYLAVHLLNTFLLLAALALTAHWATHDAPWQRPGAGAAPWLLGAGLLAVLIVGMSGAVTALGDTLFPSASLAAGFREDASPTAHFLVRLRVLHPVLALLTGLYLSVMVWQVWRVRPAAVEAPWGRRLTTLVLLQLAVGLSNLLLRAPTPVQLVHLFVADLLWLTLVLFTATALTAAPARDRLDPEAVNPGIAA